MNGETEPDKGEKSAQQPMRACKCGTRSTVGIFIVFYLKVNSVQEACAKWFAVHVLKFEILQITLKKLNK